ncbi:hypothetical protein J2801_003260 [Paraburkholderia phenoliruptrix]|uniref:hypothetical protein n=1 Tax=Paraburkholderia phenoliruptrix TaxID=252970 RepID=UPI002864F755|nr:hypothetical protein [Paraburkholderia phenoliruptrix]MDR6420979.1 hypothetical protein [Paraburkholderia phenoliruptrix]
MLYLKNTLGGLSRSLTDSALHSFQGPHRWWKLALFAVLFVLPGGSVGVAVLAWFEHRRGRKGAKGASAEIAAAPVRAASAAAAPAAPAHGAANACQSRGEAPCRAAAGKLARKATSAESRG